MAKKTNLLIASVHMSGHDDKLLKVTPLLEITEDKWEDFLNVAVHGEGIMEMGRHEHIGRPLGSGSFIENLENILDRILKPKKAGRKLKKQTEISMVSQD